MNSSKLGSSANFLQMQDSNIKNPTETQNNETTYFDHIEYNAEGVAFYVDPASKCKYKWLAEENMWVPAESFKDESKALYENEFYRWCPEKNEWILKSIFSQIESDKTSNESIATHCQNSVDKHSKSVNYSSEDGTYTFIDGDGTTFFWDTEKSAWFPKIDDDFIARYQLCYGSNGESSLKETPQERNPKGAEQTDRNGKVLTTSSSKSSNIHTKKIPESPKWFDIPAERNTKVYVNNLPPDITEDEFVQVMSKCGMIMRDPNTQKYKVKIYTEKNGQPKGDGLCDYIKVESVDLALNLLDGYDVRGKKIAVQRAKFQMRGDYNPALKPKVKKKEKEKIQKMKERLFDWRPEKFKGQRSKHERVVIIKNLFTPDQLNEEVQMISQYHIDLKEECGKCGIVRKIILHDQHPEGVTQITMSNPEEADLVVSMMNGRYFGNRRLSAEIWDGKSKYKIAKQDAVTSHRSVSWNKFLENDEMVKVVTDEPAPEDQNKYK